MSDYDNLYEDDFEGDEVASAVAKSFTGHMASTPTPHFGLPATHRVSSNGGVATATATGYGSGAAKGALQRSACSLGSSFSSYQSSSADPLLPSAHELCSSSSHSSTSSSRHHANPTRPTEGDSSARTAAEAGKGCRASPTTGGADDVVLAPGCLPTSTSPSSCSPVAPASACPSAPQTPEQHKVASNGARGVYAKLNVNDEVQVIASVTGKHPHRVSPAQSPEASITAGSSHTSSNSTLSMLSLRGRVGTTDHRIRNACSSSSVPDADARLPQRVSDAVRVSQSSSASFCSDRHDGATDLDQRHGTSAYYSAAAAVTAPAVARAAGAVTSDAHNVSADRTQSNRGSNESLGCCKALHQSNYTSVVVLADDDRSHRRTPAEIDAAAAAIEDEEKGNDDDRDVSATVSPMGAAAAQLQSLNSPLSDTYSDSFTSPTSSTFAGPSLNGHPRSPLHAAAKSASSSTSPTARASSRHASLSGAAEPLPLPHQQQPSSLTRALAGAVPPGRSTARSNSRPKNSACVAKSPASRSPATLSRSALSAASPKAQAAGGTSVHGASRQRQVIGTAGETVDAQLFNSVHDTPKRRASSSHDVVQKHPPSRFPRSNPSQASTRTSGDASLADVGVATAKGHPKTSIIAADDDDAREPDELTALLARVAHLREELATWDSRVARQRALVEAGAGWSGLAAISSSQCHSADAAGVARRRRPSSDDSRRAESVGQARLAQADAKGDGRPANARLAKLRQENEQLENQYARHGASAAGISVQTLVVRADTQLQKARQRLKVVTAARRALENRDKRAAHTIEEVHRRMPTADELQERQLNEGIYSRTGLLRTVKELKAGIERTRSATKLMEAKCSQLDAQVRRKHLSAITPKEYEALRASRDANAKTIEKHKTAIFVYATASAQDVRNGSKAATNGGCAVGGVTHSSRSSRTTSPRKSAATSVLTGVKDKEQQHALIETDEFNAEFLLQQKRTLMVRKQELQASIRELWVRVQKRDEQIKANSGATGFGFFGSASSAAVASAPFYAVGDTDSARSTPATLAPCAAKDAGTPAAGSGAAAARKRSLRDVLRSPVKRRTEATTPPTSLTGAVAPARKGSQDNAKGTVSGSHCSLQSSLPALAQTGKRTVRAERQPSSSALTALANSPVKRSAPMGSSSAGAGEMPVPAAATSANARRASLPALSRDAIEAEVGARDSIESAWRKIDASGRQLGQGVSKQKRSKEAAPPAFLQGLNGADRVKAVNGVHGDSGVFEEESALDEMEEAECGRHTRRADQRGHAIDTAVRPHGACDGQVLEEPLTEDIEEERGVRENNGSGRSTPEWLRED
ncbi:hypothetical protein GH5_07446 [Leishmania sp. Ghana 2012 LV757]|uniref:hypothetical protein n=1 Tax=Leishmania sp. Ghana 2012 LV757 TaxID=2803181 RepID=UPI001B702AC8|nr:hypothetical protein GH5_07446 [Leishmania sp. Ghana 2012 LV757]